MSAVHPCAVTLGAIVRPSAGARGSPRGAIGARAHRASTRISAASSSRDGTLFGARAALSGAATPAARFTATRADVSMLLSAAVARRAPSSSNRGGSRSVVTMGLPIPIIGGLFSAPVLAVMYVFVAIRFYLNYGKTNFTERNKAMMIGLWPVLAVASASFRENLKKATL